MDLDPFDAEGTERRRTVREIGLYQNRSGWEYAQQVYAQPGDAIPRPNVPKPPA